MMHRLWFVAVLSIFVYSGCSRPNIQTIDSQFYSSDGRHVKKALTDTVTFEQELEGHLAMPEAVQEEIRELADKELVQWRDFETEVKISYDSIYRSWYQDGNYRKRIHRGVGLGNSLVALGKATDIDPSFVEAWAARGRLASEAGDIHSGLEYLDAARLAADVRRESGRPVDEEIQLEIYRQRAWALRDLARWDEGLAAVQEGLEFKHGDRDLVLIKGLLLAGAGRYSEAVSLAVRMPPMSYPKFGLLNWGLEYEKSAYANLWIRSQALMAIGDYKTAWGLFGDMSLYPYRGVLPHSDRFWEDVGIVAELNDVEDAPVYYAIGYITRKYDRYYPVGAANSGPMVLDVPNGRMPCYTSFGQRFYVAGSPFSYIALQMNQMSLGIFPDQKMQAAGRALRALEVVERRNIRPDVCRALRGRIFYFGDDFQGAHTELKAAREGFRSRGEVDAGTSLLLGMLELQGERYQPAARYMEEAVDKDPASAVGWRSLGIVYANLGLGDKAVIAMDKGLQLQPHSVSGLYNRGLYQFNNQEYLKAAADLDLALRLEPDNREIERLLMMAGQGYLGSGGDMADLPGEGRNFDSQIPAEAALATSTVDSDSLLTRLEAEIEGFFTVSDSLDSDIEGGELGLSDLATRYVQTRDVQTRKMLALAYIDAKEFVKTQSILAPHWGVDLEPEEEIMLLYVDRMLGEQERARLLAEELVAGEAGTDNPYVWALTALAIRDDPRAVDFSYVNSGFLGKMSYGLAKEPWTSVFGWSAWARVGFANVRASTTIDPDVRLPLPDSAYPFFRSVRRNAVKDEKGRSEPMIK